MKNSIINLLKNTWGLLIFALLSGCAYYVIVLKFILKFTKTGGGLLGFFFLPAIVCGAALVLIKLIKQFFENGREGSVLALFWLHVVFILMSIVFAISIIG
jgi:hypothetical protein